MRTALALIILFLFALAACSAPATESISELSPGNDEAVPAQEPEATAPAAAQTSAESSQAGGEEAAPCNIAEIPDPAEGMVMIRFLNLSGEEITGAWHNTTLSPAELMPSFHLGDRNAFDQETFVGHEWLLRNEEAHLMLDYVATAEAKQCVEIYPHFGYEGQDAPENWAQLSDHYEKCSSGREQSPIDLTNAAADDFLENIVLDYKETAVNIINNGHTIQVNVTQGSQITINGEAYRLSQFHFHAPSEHTIDGRAFPLEMHLVHRREDKLAVVGVFIAQGAENSAFAPVWAHLPQEELGIVATGATVDLASLLPAAGAFYHYSGSLTTPPCSEDVTWLVMKNSIEMSAEQIETFTSIIKGNNRPPQPLNERELALDETP